MARRVASGAELEQVRLSQYRVKVGGRIAKRSPAAFVVPKGATSYSVEFKPQGGRWLKVSTIIRPKGHRSREYVGLGKLRKANREPVGEGKGRKYQTAYAYITKELEGDPWQLLPRALRALPAWATKDGVFFQKQADLKRTWTQVAVWYAIEAEGFSDGQRKEKNRRAWYVDALYTNIRRQKLKGGMHEAFRDLVVNTLFGRDGVVQSHNNEAKAKFNWFQNYVFLGVEGVKGEISRTGAFRRRG